jgi:hypothetical protein
MKAKPILLVLLTLVIGFILGMLTSAQIRLNKLKPVRLYFSEERFREGFFKTIQPDEKQKAEIVQILDKYAKMNSELQNNLRKELDSNIKEMRKELDSKLTKEQLARLKDMDDRRQEMIRQGRRNRNDSSNFRDMRRGMREGRPFPDNRPMHPGERPPFHQTDTNKLPDSK